MISKIYTIKDTKIGHMAPFLMQNDAVAIRTFENMAKQTTPNAVNTYPEDKELWEIGEFEDQTGEIKSHEPRFVTKAIDYITKTEG